MARIASSGPPAVAVVTVSYESDEVLPGFLSSIPGAVSWPVTVIVADNRPDAGETARIARDAGASYLPLPENPGYGSAVNAAARTLPQSVRWILVSNPDVRLSAGAIDELLATAETSDDVGTVGPAIETAEGALYPSARAVPSIRIGVGHALFGNVWKTNPWSRAYLQGRSAQARDAGWLSGACVLVRRSLFDELGGFDPGYFMYFEDVDLGARVGKAGYRNIYQPVARVVHSGAHSTVRHGDAMIRAHHRSAARFIDRRYPAGWQAPIRWSLHAGLAVRSWFVRRTPSSVDSTRPHSAREDRS